MVNILYPKDFKNLDDLQIETAPLEPFSPLVLAFIEEVSKTILHDPLFKQYPELMALAFWMRKAHLRELEEEFRSKYADRVLLGRGVVFHIAPSNVDTIFVYSWFISMLAGNSNIVRVSNKSTIQTTLLLQTISDTLEAETYVTLKNRIAIVAYGHDDEITQVFSKMADVRVIWGGNRTIDHIRSIPIPPASVELTFADKFSMAILKSSELIAPKETDALLEKFYNDAFWFAQMACSSIRLIVWIGTPEENRQAKARFWDALSRYLSERTPQTIDAADIVNKVVAQYALAIEERLSDITRVNPYVHRVELSCIDDPALDLHCGSGLFYEYQATSLDVIIPSMTKRFQTIAQFGFEREDIVEVLRRHRPRGIDRIVPIGKALEFSPIWDGYDLFRSFCREVEVWN